MNATSRLNCTFFTTQLSHKMLDSSQAEGIAAYVKKVSYAKHKVGSSARIQLTKALEFDRAEK